jgi:hypothetical protein
MAKLVKLELTDTECLSVRMALNECGMAWGDKASAARNAGNDEDAATCERIRADYGRLWDMVNEAQEAPGRVQDWTYRRAAPVVRSSIVRDGGDNGYFGLGKARPAF